MTSPPVEMARTRCRSAVSRRRALMTCRSGVQTPSTSSPYSHTDSEVVYDWGPVTVKPYLTVPKYSLIKLETGSCLLQTSIGSYSCKRLSASFRPDVNFFATEVYGATFLLVALSWTGFWVDPRRYGGGGAAVRLGLGLVIVLILVVYGVGFRLLHNKVGVPGNVEVWVAFCTLFVLASLIEYVFVHVLLCTVPSQFKRVCCKWRPLRRATSCQFNETDTSAVSMSADESATSYQKAAHVIDVTCGLLFPFIFVLLNVAYWLTY